MEDKRKESHKEKLEHLKRLSGWKEKECKVFIDLVSKYLDGCGYFMGDFNIHCLPTPEGFIKYSDRDFGTWLLDMALQYNIEQGKEYFCKLIGDRQRQEFDDKYYKEDWI